MANKGVTIAYSMLWTAFLFREKITLNNIIGAVIVVVGIVLVSLDDKVFCDSYYSWISFGGSTGITKEKLYNSKESHIKEYLNVYVICGYGHMGLSMLLRILAYKGMPYKYGSMLEVLAYFYAMIIGKVFFGEILTVKRGLGRYTLVM